jgi:hypothetical protein
LGLWRKLAASLLMNICTFIKHPLLADIFQIPPQTPMRNVGGNFKMDILLRKKYSYTVASSYDETKAKLEAILNAKWYDFSKKYYGTIDDDGSFTFKQKIVFFSLRNFGQTIYLNGNLVKNDKDTTIDIKLSPNIVFVFIIYLLPLLLLNILFGDNSLMGQTNGRLNNFFVVLLIELAIFTIIQVVSFFLRRKFEKVMIESNYNKWKTNFTTATNDN